MFEEFYEMYEPEEQEVVALINRCIGGGFNWKGNFWEMTVVTLGVVFCDTGKVSTKEERLDWPVTDEERNSEKGWGRFGKEQICRLKIRRMKEEWAKDLVVQPWCISQVVKAHEDCPELQAVLDEYHKPVVIQDQVLGELTLDKDYDTFEGEIQWCGKDVSLSLEVNAESKPSWTRARSAAKKLLAEAFPGEKLVLIENEFGEINIDGGFLKESGIEISEMSAGCICCSLVGDFNKALKEVVAQFHPDRILIEPSGVGKLSDVIVAVQRTVDECPELKLNSYVTVADASKVKVYMKNFGEFYNNQIETANTCLLYTSDAADEL